MTDATPPNVPTPDALSPEQVARRLSALDAGWQVSPDGKVLTRRITVTGFAPALALTRQIGELAKTLNHHPDLCLGWGYCQVIWTSHDAGGLTPRDFVAAAQTDALIAAAMGS